MRFKQKYIDTPIQQHVYETTSPIARQLYLQQRLISNTLKKYILLGYQYLDQHSKTNYIQNDIINIWADVKSNHALDYKKKKEPTRAINDEVIAQGDRIIINETLEAMCKNLGKIKETIEPYIYANGKVFRYIYSAKIKILNLKREMISIEKRIY